VQLGEDLLSRGQVDEAVEHLGSAIAVCGHPQQLLQVLQGTLPPEVFHLLLQRLPMIGQSVHAQLAAYGPIDGAPSSSTSGTPGMSTQRSEVVIEDELE